MSVFGNTRPAWQLRHVRSNWCGGCLALLGSLVLIGCQSAKVQNQPFVVAVVPQENDPSELSASLSSPEKLMRRSIELASASTSEQTTAADTSWLSTIHSEFNFARNLVEQELGVDLDNINLYVVDDKPINNEVAIETRRLVHKQFGASDFSKHFLAQIMNPLADTYAAVYSSRLGAVMISRNMLASYESSLDDAYDETVKRAALLTLLIHELVHAADDQRYRIHDNRALNFRASFAQSATFEGHAQWVTRRICKKALCSAGLTALDDFMFSVDQTDPQDMQPAEAINRSVLEYSYIEGERFIEALAQRDNGSQLIDELLRNPPLDPIQILAPENFPDTERDKRNQQLITASRDIAHPWTLPPWMGVETSPLKGVDLRSDPDRRQAAVDGFTRLITGMVSMQFYDQTTTDASPIEATILQAESANTARLFASTLHANTQHSGAQVNDETMQLNTDNHQPGAVLDVHLYRTSLDADAPFNTAIAVAGLFVVQVSGNAVEQSLLDDYALQVMINLNRSKPMALVGDHL